MTSIGHTILAGAISVASGFLALSIKIYFEAMYEGVAWPAAAEITVRHGPALFIMVVPSAMACISVIASIRKQSPVGALTCHLLACIGIAVLAYAVYVMAGSTTFKVGHI